MPEPRGFIVRLRKAPCIGAATGWRTGSRCAANARCQTNRFPLSVHCRPDSHILESYSAGSQTDAQHLAVERPLCWFLVAVTRHLTWACGLVRNVAFFHSAPDDHPHTNLLRASHDSHVTGLINGDREGRRSGTDFNRINFATSVACMSNIMHGCNLHALHMHDVLSAPPCLLQMQQLALLLLL